MKYDLALKMCSAFGKLCGTIAQVRWGTLSKQHGYFQLNDIVKCVFDLHRDFASCTSAIQLDMPEITGSMLTSNRFIVETIFPKLDLVEDIVDTSCRMCPELNIQIPEELEPRARYENHYEI